MFKLLKSDPKIWQLNKNVKISSDPSSSFYATRRR